MDSPDIIADAFEQIRALVHAVVDDIAPSALTYRVDPEANTIAWLVWHLTRVQDDHVASAAGTPQLWGSEGWVDRFALPFDSSDIGYGMDAAEVGFVEVEPVSLLAGYHDAVSERTTAWVRGLGAADLDRVVDEAYDPPVTLGVRLMSVVAEDLQHVGQAALLRGVTDRRG